MNIALWIVQVLLALHTIMGAAFKFSHSPAQTMPSLKAIPPGVWMVMTVLEILCGLGLLVPALSRSLAILAPIAAIYIIAEMLLFTGLHLASGPGAYGPVMYWLVVAAVAAFVAYGRLKLKR